LLARPAPIGAGRAVRRREPDQATTCPICNRSSTAPWRTSPLRGRPPSSRTPRRATSARPESSPSRLKALAALSPEQKKLRGAEINAAKQAIDAALVARRAALAEAQLESQLAAQALDVTLPGRSRGSAGIHPVSRALERIEAIFASMGFDIADGPEIETDWYSFTALNNPENHPARSMQDTFYVDLKDDEGRWLNLRPHTSPMQIRYAQAHAKKHAGAARMPDVRVIAPGRTYRVDNDATHSPMFHQVEGLWLGEDVSFRDLKAVYLDFMQAFFETERAEAALPAELLSVHRAERRDRPDVRRRSARRPLARDLRDRVRSIRRSCATWGSIPSA
jgi:phenylalanyl-tRNA synthetase alpha subunit